MDVEFHDLKTTPPTDINTRCSPRRFVQMIEKLRNDQRIVVEELGFGSLLELKCTKLRRNLCTWLVNHFEVDCSYIRIGEKRIPVTPMAVHRVMGLRSEGDDEIWKENLTEEEKAQSDSLKMRYNFVGTSSNISIPLLERKILEAGNNGDDFKRDFTLHAMASILCPTTTNGPPISYLKYVLTTSSIPQYNWAKIVYDSLIHGIKKYKDESTTSYVSGPLIFLQLLFCEYVIKGCLGSSKSNVGPAIQHWTNPDIDKIFKVIGEDFTNSEVFICSEDEFVQNHPFTDNVGQRGEEVTLDDRFKVFEDRLKFLEDRCENLACTSKSVVQRVDALEVKIDKLNDNVIEVLNILKGKRHSAMGEECDDEDEDDGLREEEWESEEKEGNSVAELKVSDMFDNLREEEKESEEKEGNSVAELKVSDMFHNLREEEKESDEKEGNSVAELKVSDMFDNLREEEKKSEEKEGNSVAELKVSDMFHNLREEEKESDEKGKSVAEVKVSENAAIRRSVRGKEKGPQCKSPYTSNINKRKATGDENQKDKRKTTGHDKKKPKKLASKKGNLR